MLDNKNLKPNDYYSQNRLEMLDFIPKNSKKVLDLGCGQGNFAKILKDKLEVEVWGVEVEKSEAEIARKKLDKLIIAKLEDVAYDLPDNYFDCLVFNDILEHLTDPYSVLNDLRAKLTKNGVMVASIPNVRYFFNLKELIVDKNWRYSSSGILDKTHLRFFTKKSIIETLKGLNFEILTIKGVNPIKLWRFNLLNILLLNYLNDTRYMQYACVFKDKKYE